MRFCEHGPPGRANVCVRGVRGDTNDQIGIIPLAAQVSRPDPPEGQCREPKEHADTFEILKLIPGHGAVRPCDVKKAVQYIFQYLWTGAVALLQSAGIALETTGGLSGELVEPSDVSFAAIVRPEYN